MIDLLRRLKPPSIFRPISSERKVTIMIDLLRRLKLFLMSTDPKQLLVTIMIDLLRRLKRKS